MKIHNTNIYPDKNDNRKNDYPFQRYRRYKTWSEFHAINIKHYFVKSMKTHFENLKSKEAILTN